MQLRRVLPSKEKDLAEKKKKEAEDDDEEKGGDGIVWLSTVFEGKRLQNRQQMTRHPLPMRVFNDGVDGDETKTTTKQQMMMLKL